MKKSLIFSIVCLLAGVNFALAQQQTVISGTLLGADGKPMARADVHLIRPQETKAMASTKVSADGSFSISTGETGLVLVQFTGAGHNIETAALIVDKPLAVNLNVRLQTYEYLKDFGEIKVIGNFNKYSTKTAKVLEKQPDGTYAAEIETSEEKLLYQLMGLAKSVFPISGTESEDYAYEGFGRYRSVLSTSNGKARVVFDPKKVLRSETKSEIRFKDPNSTAAKFSSLYSEISRHQADIQKIYELQREGGDLTETALNLIDWMQSLSKRFRTEKDPLIRQYLLVAFIEMSRSSSYLTTMGLSDTAMSEIEPISPLWTLYPGILGSNTVINEKDRRYNNNKLYLQQVIERHPDKNVRAYLLYNYLIYANRDGKKEKQKELYEQLVSKYGDTRWAREAMRFDPDPKVTVGKMAPAISFVSFDDSKKILSNESMKGKFYLIDFWATWCGPCLGEMGHLHQAYEKFKDKNFEILSLSFDQAPEDVRKFRADKWKMPWQHAFVEGGFQNKVAQEYNVLGIPKPILIDATGKIVATEGDLRGDRLEKTLERILGAPGSTTALSIEKPAELIALEKAYNSNPQDAELKKKFIRATYDFGHKVMMDAALVPRVKYPEALHQFRRVLELNPNHQEAAADKKQIEDIYASMGRPVPE